MGTIESKDNNNCTINSFETAFITYGNFIISKYDSGNLNHQHGILELFELYHSMPKELSELI